MNKYLHFIFHNKKLLGMFYSDCEKWEMVGSKRSLCELVYGKYLPESELSILTVNANEIKTVNLE